MTEQKQEKKEEKELEKIKEKNPNRKKVRWYCDNEPFVERLLEVYNDNPNYSETARRLNEEFNTNITSSGVKNIYMKKMAKVTITNVKSKNFLDDSYDKMTERWNDAWDMVGDLAHQYKKLREASRNMEDTERALSILKMTPTIIQITTEMRKQLEFIQSQQSQLTVERDNQIFSTLQITQSISGIFKRLVKEGYIKILKKLPSEFYEDEK